MNSVSTEHELDAEGRLRLDLPLGAAEAGRKVLVTVTPLPRPMSREEYEAWVLSMAGTWQGDFEEINDPPPSDPAWIK